jgi:rubrerythrin
MPLNKEQMREYMKNRGLKEKMEAEGFQISGEPAVKPFLEQACALCGRTWNSYTPISCPYCKGKGKPA